MACNGGCNDANSNMKQNSQSQTSIKNTGSSVVNYGANGSNNLNKYQTIGKPKTLLKRLY